MAINGTNLDDEFTGTRFDDEINGLGGDDFIRGSRGQDRLDGGQGSDSVDYSVSSTHLNPLSVNDWAGKAVDIDLQRATQIGGFADGDVLISIENVGGSFENDVIRGNGEANILVGNGGDDFIEGRAGDDRLFGEGTGFDLGGAFGFSGDSGNDVLDGGAGNDELFGGFGHDTLIGGADNDELFGEDGDDTLIGGTGTNIVDGGAGIDTASYAGSAFGMQVNLVGSSSNGIAFSLGSRDGDSLFSVENIIGSNLADSITGSSVANVLDGGGGNDLIAGGGGADTLIGGAGIDTASYSGSSVGVTVNLATLGAVNTPFGVVLIQTVAGTGAGGDAQGDTLSGFENLKGSNFADTLTGNIDANLLDGGAGDDTLSAGAGNDVLIGGADTDIERLTGGAGSDTFVYLNRSDSNISATRSGDFILDFNVNEDSIDLRPLQVNAADLLITNDASGAVHVARVTEDLNHNGQSDANELAISIILQGPGIVTLQDVLI